MLVFKIERRHMYRKCTHKCTWQAKVASEVSKSTRKSSPHSQARVIDSDSHIIIAGLTLQ